MLSSPSQWVFLKQLNAFYSVSYELSRSLCEIYVHSMRNFSVDISVIVVQLVSISSEDVVGELSSNVLLSSRTGRSCVVRSGQVCDKCSLRDDVSAVGGVDAHSTSLVFHGHHGLSLRDHDSWRSLCRVLGE